MYASSFDEQSKTASLPDQRVRWSVDAHALRSAAVLRLSAAGAVSFGGIVAVWVGSLGPVAWVLVGFGFAVSLGWLLVGVRGLRRAARGEDALELSEDGITIHAGPARRAVPWTDVVGVSVDEDRLIVRVETTSRDVLVIEPIYGRGGVYDLYQCIGDYRASLVGSRGVVL